MIQVFKKIIQMAYQSHVGEKWLNGLKYHSLIILFKLDMQVK